MNKADKAALEYARTLSLDYNQIYDAVKYGYQQAEKDLELTWEDVESIHTLMAHQEVTPIFWKCGKEAFYQEVLKRFKNMKK